jgi:hypothetical protein
MEEDKAVAQWLADLYQRLNKTKNSLTKEQALMELLVKITQLMKDGDFKKAAVLRTEFDHLNIRDTPGALPFDNN